MLHIVLSRQPRGPGSCLPLRDNRITRVSQALLESNGQGIPKWPLVCPHFRNHCARSRGRIPRLSKADAPVSQTGREQQSGVTAARASLNIPSLRLQLGFDLANNQEGSRDFLGAPDRCAVLWRRGELSRGRKKRRMVGVEEICNFFLAWLFCFFFCIPYFLHDWTQGQPLVGSAFVSCALPRASLICFSPHA